jgi:hypothetical protein
MIRKIIFALIFSFTLLYCFHSFSQKVNVKDSSVFAPMITVNYAFQLPGGDLAKRFGDNSSIGGSFMIKTKSNYLLGLDGNFIFSGQIKEDSLFSNISTIDGHIITANGEFADVRTYERGFTTSFKAGKIFPLLGPNPNSGFVFIGSVGLLQHKIRIETPGNTVPELKGDYKKGYDHLTNGLCISEFVGYMYLGNKRLVSFYAGFEFIQAWTQCRRDYNFSTMTRENNKRFDLMNGIKVGWIIPFYVRTSKNYYYY